MNFKFKTHVYPYTIHVFIDETSELSLAEHKKYYNADVDYEDFDALTIYPTSRNHKTVAIILGTDQLNNLFTNIHHESIHAAIHILHQLGIEISYNNDEAITYLSSYIFDTICKKLKMI